MPNMSSEQNLRLANAIENTGTKVFKQLREADQQITSDLTGASVLGDSEATGETINRRLKNRKRQKEMVALLAAAETIKGSTTPTLS